MIGEDADVLTVPVSQGESSRPPTQSDLSVYISDAFNEIFGTGDFSSFEDFEKTFATFQVCTHSVYRVHKSATVSAENEWRKEKVEEKFKYMHTTFVCVHYGPIQSKAEGKCQKQRLLSCYLVVN